MSEPLSYKDLEKLIKDLKSEKQLLSDELYQREKIFQAKENLLQQIVSDTNEGVLVIQRDEIKFFNQTALNFLGFSSLELEQFKFTELIHKDYQGQVIQFLSEINENIA